MSLGVGSIVSIGGGTGGSGGGGSSGITEINGQIGPIITVEGVNGIDVSVPSSNTILLDGVALSGITTQSGVIGVNGIDVQQIDGEFVVDGATLSGLIAAGGGHSFQAAYDGGDHFVGEGTQLPNGLFGVRGAIASDAGGTHDYFEAGLDLLTTPRTNFMYAASGISTSEGAAALTTIRPEATLIKGSGASPATLLMGVDGVSAKIQTSGFLDVDAANSIFVDTPESITIRATGMAGEFPTFLNNINLITTGDGNDIRLSAHHQVALFAFEASGSLQYLFGPNEAWHVTTSAPGAPAGPFPLPHSGQICHMILEKIEDSRFSQSFAGITSGLFTHNLGSMDVVVQIRDRATGGASVLLPDQIIVENLNQVSVLFNRPQSGRVVIV